MILLSDDQIQDTIGFQIAPQEDIVIQIQPYVFARAIAKAQAEKMFKELEKVSEEVAHVPECGCACRCVYLAFWQELRKELE